MRLIERPKAEIVAKVLELIAEDQYSINEGEEGEGEENTIFNAGEAPYEHLLEAMQELEKMHKEASGPENELTLEEAWSDLWTFKLIELLFSRPQDREKMFSILRGRCHEDVVIYLQ